MFVNGKNYEPPIGASIKDILDAQGFDLNRVAVLLNDEIVPKERLGNTVPGGADSLEVVSFVGGG